MDEEFKPDFRDMQAGDYKYRGKSLNQAKRGRAIASRNYRHRNKEKLDNYEVKNPILRLRLKSEEMATLKQMAMAFEETPQKLVRRVVLDLIREFRSRTK